MAFDVHPDLLRGAIIVVAVVVAIVVDVAVFFAVTAVVAVSDVLLLLSRGATTMGFPIKIHLRCLSVTFFILFL